MEQYIIKGGHPLVGEVEIGGAKKVLSAAAMTYVTALVTSLIHLLTLVMRVRGRND